MLTDTRYLRAGDSDTAPTLAYAVWSVSADQGGTPNRVSEPGSLALLEAGLVGLLAVRRRDQAWPPSAELSIIFTWFE